MGSDQRYEDVAYAGRPFHQTHPARLAAIARLFGVPAPDPATSRVLEIGSGDGGNLLPMADRLPGASFTGIDTSSSATAAARGRAAALGLSNTTFEEVSLADFEPAAGSFDYVIAHGVFSWVPAPVRDALLALTSRALSEHGVAYISYNALPGGRVRQVVREILARQLEGIDDAAERLAAARERLAVLRTAWGSDEALSSLSLVATSALQATDALLYHDTLSPDNAPLYFRDFVAQAGHHGLQFLSEANFWETQVGWLAPELQPAVAAIGDRLRREQELDFLRMRTFRQTLLCRAAQPLTEIEPQRLEGLAAAAWLTADEPGADGEVTFRGSRGQVLTTGHERVIAALRRLADAWPAALAVRELWPADSGPEDREAVCTMLLRCLSADLVTLHAAPLALGSAGSPRPRAGELARLQAGAAGEVTNLRHEPVALDERTRLLVMQLDGSRDRAALHDAFPGDLDAALRELERLALLLPDA